MERVMGRPGLTPVHGDDTADSLKEPLIETQLLSPFGDGDEHKSGIYEVEPSDDVKVSGRAVWEEVKKLCWIAGPMIAVSLFQYSLRMISVMMVGHLGELALSSASIATSFANVTGLHVLMGMAGALETLCGQANGAKQYHLLGIQLQRAIVALYCVSIPIAVIWAYMGHILVALGQDPLISFEAGNFARWMIPSLFATAALQPLVKFLQSQGVVFPMMLSSSITLCFHVPVCWVLVFKVGLGNKGAALANSISNWLNVVLLSIYVKFSPACKKTWTSFSREALYDITNFLKLAIPSTVMLCLEYWSFEMLVLFSGLLPKPELEMSVLSICLSTGALAYMIPFGLGAAVSTRVSNELGAGRSRTAQLSVCVGVSMAVIEALMIGSIFFSVRNVWGYVYSNEVEVVEYISSMMPLLAPSTFMDAIQGVLSGIARGCGWQKLGAYANLGAYYVVGMPIAVILAFVLHLGGRGLWLGLICGLFAQTVLLSIITFCTNWEEQAKKARERVYTSALPTVTSNIIKMGMACALETLCGQAYGAKQYHLLGIQLQRAIVALFCVSIPLAVIWIYMGDILKALGQDPLISFEAGKFARWMLPSLFAYVALQPLLKFLQSQGIVIPMMLSSAVTVCFHVPVCWVLVFKVGLGNKGAALAISISNWLNVALLSLYVIFSPACEKTRTSFSREALYDIANFLNLAIPSAVMICLEYWSFEMLVLLSGLLPNPELEMSVLSVCLSTAALAYMIPFGLGAAVSTRVSNELGAGRSCAAQLSVRVGVCMAATEALMIASALFSARNVWGYVYSNEREVVDYISSMMPLLASSAFMDANQGILAGIARGCGWQTLGAYVNLGAYYAVGIPIAVILAFLLHLGGRGLWIGIFCGLSSQTLVLFIITFCTNWEAQAKKARERVYTSALPTVADNIIKAEQ